MGFLKNNENIILMDRTPAQVGKYVYQELRIPKEGLLMLRSAGIQTSMHCETDWGSIEPSKGVYNWDMLDNRIQLLKDCGMKVLIQSCFDPPVWIPEEWLLKINNKMVAKDPASFSVLSPWCPEAMDYLNQYYIKLRDRYNSDDSMVIDSWLNYGETYLPNWPSWYDTYALASYHSEFKSLPNKDGYPNISDYSENKDLYSWINEAIVQMMSEHAQILVHNKWKELWIMGHTYFINHPCCGNNSIFNILQSYFDIDAKINHLYYTWMQWPGLWPQMNKWKEQFNEEIFGGAEGAGGVNTVTDSAIPQGLRGLIIDPSNIFAGCLTIEDWMCDNIKEANQKWQTKNKALLPQKNNQHKIFI